MLKILQKLRISRPYYRPGSLAWAAAKILPARVVDPVIAATADSRTLIAQISAATKIPQEVLLREAAAILDLNFVTRVLPVNPTLLPRRIPLSHCYQAGCIPLVARDAIAGFVCVDPSLVKPLAEIFPGVPCTLALWSDIARALDLSEDLTQALPDSRSRTLGDLLRHVVRQVEVFNQKGCEVQLLELGAQICFVTAGGRPAQAQISADIAAEFFSYLESLSPGPAYLPEQDGDRALLISICIDRARRSAVLSWDKQDRQHLIKQRAAEPRSAAVMNFPETAKSVNAAGDRLSKVLVIDDNLTFCKVLDRFLGRVGVEVVIAADAQKALDQILSDFLQPDLIICDLHMPGMNGAEFLAAVRADPRVSALPIIMLTSDADSETELRLIQQGADIFITKSEDPRLLCAHVKRLIERNRLQRSVA